MISFLLATLAAFSPTQLPQPEAVQSTKLCILRTCAYPPVIIHIRLRTGRAPTFDVGLEMDGKSVSCKLGAGVAVDPDAPNCGDSVRVAVRDEWNCDDANVGCIPTGRQEEQIGIWGTPSMMTLTLSGGAKTLSQSFVPKYVMSFPNGPECDPGCKNWQTVWFVE